MASVQTAPVLDASTHSMDGPTLYTAYNASSRIRKHHQDFDEVILPRNTKPTLERVMIPEDCRPLKRINSPRSPLLSPYASRLAEAASAFAKTAMDQSCVNVIKQEIRCSSIQQYPFLRELFVSPHPDDICYSCFSTVSKGKEEKDDGKHSILSRDNDPGRAIVTVFSKSRCANGELGEKLKRNVEDISRVRKDEDEQFAETVGCKLISLGLPDSSARDEFSRSWTHLADEDLQEQNSTVKSHPFYYEAQKALDPIIRWAIQCKAAIYMPLAIGCHVDHLMTRVAVSSIFEEIKMENRLIKLPIKLTYYEDLPYAYYQTEEYIQKLVKTVISKTAEPTLIEVDEECWEKKRRAVLGYATQMKPIILPALHERAVTLASLEKTGLCREEHKNLKERIWLV